ncbi:AAA family ATPase [Cryobacterium sp. TMT3-29-2]|uniref:AAA family ATPase n=1 Tax=Cryobacterium sp. TMT3-29-2 TaxID=2555867 RepID=UPI0014312E81|nr:AAA family ATPase [Cryobacterium sp. TMT3-29-2]
MIIWLNGPFGGGKTTLAQELCERDESFVLFDTEEVGRMLRHALDVRRPVNDFQDWPAWRTLVIATAIELVADLECDLVIPQSVFDHAYWNELTTGFASAELAVRAFTLMVHPDEHERRILQDVNEPDAADWRLSRLPNFQKALFWLEEETTAIDTTSRTPAEVASFILEELATTRP